MIRSESTFGARRLLFLFLPACLVCAGGCREGRIYTRSQEIMGTVFSVKVWAARSGSEHRETVEGAVEDALARAREIEAAMSEFRSGSSVSRVNRAAGLRPVEVDPMTWEVIRAAIDMGRETGGAFDITFAPLAELWDYKAEKPKLPSPDRVKERLKLVGLDGIVLDPDRRTVLLGKKGAKIGLGGVAKGYALDEMAAALEGKGIADYIIYGGGDLMVNGKKGGDRWKVGVQHPRKGGAVMAHFSVEGRRAVATSGDYERFFELGGKRYHHILDPRSGMPARGCVSATVVAASALRADALATALVVLGPVEGKTLLGKLGDFQALLIDENLEFTRMGSFPELVRSPPP